MPRRENKYTNLRPVAALIAFGIAFGFVEAAVVYYLRLLLNVVPAASLGQYKTFLNLGFIAFVQPLHPLIMTNVVTRVEAFRELATIVMLACVAYLSGTNRRYRVAAFLITFATWDIFYYIFLKVLMGWPSTLMTRDIYFLIPVTWIGPVITPIVISTALLAVGVTRYINSK